MSTNTLRFTVFCLYTSTTIVFAKTSLLRHLCRRLTVTSVTFDGFTLPRVTATFLHSTQKTFTFQTFQTFQDPDSLGNTSYFGFFSFFSLFDKNPEVQHRNDNFSLNSVYKFKLSDIQNEIQKCADECNQIQPYDLHNGTSCLFFFCMSKETSAAVKLFRNFKFFIWL